MGNVLSEKHGRWLFGLGLVVFALPLAFKQIIDVDIWWHLVNGKVLLTEGRIPDVNDYYFTPVVQKIIDFRYILAGDTLFAAIHMLAGDIGLQVFALICLGLSCYWVAAVRKGPFHLGHFLLLCGFILATYQFQIVRNALYGLPLLCLTLYLLHRFHGGSRRALWWLPLVLFVWSFCHGTYLMGFAITTLWLFGQGLDRLLHEDDDASPPVRFGPLTERFLVLIISFFAIWIANPLTSEQVQRVMPIGGDGLLWLFLLMALATLYVVERAYSSVLKRRGALIATLILVGIGLAVLVGAFRFFPPFFEPGAATTRVDMMAPTMVEAEPQDNFWLRLSVAFNNLVWNTQNREFASGDFSSPFENLGLVYIWSSYFLGLLAFIAMIRRKQRALAVWLPYMTVLVLALGYKRTVGFLGLYAVFVLMRLPARESNPWQNRPRWQVATTVVVCAALSIAAGIFKLFPIGLWGTHQFGPGHAIFLTEPSPETMSELADKQTFNVISNGGYLLHRWYPERKVYIDGFFAPHRGETFDTYYQTLLQNVADAPNTRHNTDGAIIPLHQTSWIKLFNHSQNWYPHAMNAGSLTYTYSANFEESVKVVRLEFTSNDVEEMPAYFRPVVANRTFEMVTTYIFKGRVAMAQQFAEQHKDLLNALRPYAANQAVDDMERNLALALERYGPVNDRSVRYELLYYEALSQGMIDPLIRNGEALLRRQPDRYDVALTLARAKASNGQLRAARTLLERIGTNTQVNVSFWQDQRTTVADAWISLADAASQRQEWSQALNDLSRAATVDPTRMPRRSMVQRGMNMYRQLLNARKPDVAYRLLMQLDQAVPQAPHVLYSLAWHKMQHRQPDQAGMQDALQQALQAAQLMAERFPDEVGKAYSLIGEIYKRLGQNDQAERYRQAAASGRVIEQP